MTYEITPTQEKYLGRQMRAVSRSFALVTPNVVAPLNHILSTAYLICRVLDNIEDCTQPFPWQQARFAEFNALLQSPERASTTLQRWHLERWPGLDADEIALMGPDEGLPLWQIYAAIPEMYQHSVRRWVLEMSIGMERISDPLASDMFTTRQGIRLPQTAADYDQYCFYVAGTVGHMATELVNTHYGVQDPQANALLVSSEACGRALQKTNILKDFAKDLRRDACFLPDSWLQQVDYAPLRLENAPAGWKLAVIDNILQELDHSLAYVHNLPPDAVGYRRASLLAMLPAYETLYEAARHHERLFTPEHKAKISRATMMRCLYDARRLATDNDGVTAVVSKMRQKVFSAFEQTTMMASF